MTISLFPNLDMSTYNTYDQLRGELDFYFNKLPEIITEKRYTWMSSRYLKMIESNSNLYKILISGNVNTFEVFPRVLPGRHAKLRLNRLALVDSEPLAIKFNFLISQIHSVHTRLWIPQRKFPSSKFLMAFLFFFILLVNNIGWH